MEFEGLKNKTALLVDSSEENCRLLRVLLQDDLHILEAHSIDQAIDVVGSDENVIDIILLDIVFPEKNGYDFLEFLREHRFLDDTPVIIVTDDTSDSSVERCF